MRLFDLLIQSIVKLFFVIFSKVQDFALKIFFDRNKVRCPQVAINEFRRGGKGVDFNTSLVHLFIAGIIASAAGWLLRGFPNGVKPQTHVWCGDMNNERDSAVGLCFTCEWVRVCVIVSMILCDSVWLCMIVCGTVSLKDQKINLFCFWLSEVLNKDSNRCKIMCEKA